MEIVITRTYHAAGTNGRLYINGKQAGFTIELPWRNNQPQVSCIPEGRYLLVKRMSEKFQLHMLVTGVPNRELILIHKANNALEQLKGCIAPVTTLTGEGCGDGSHNVFSPLRQLVYAALDKGEQVWLTIVKNP